MKRIGLIGGMGPEATVEYYKEIINSFKNSNENLNYPEIIIYSVNLSEFVNLMKEKKYDQATGLLLKKINSLEHAGAEFAALTANTPHLMFEQIKEKSPITLISIVEATCREALKKGFNRCGLIGTAFTMNSTFFADVFKNYSIEVVVPGTNDIELIDNKLFNEIELGIFKEETRDLFIGIINKMVNQQHIDSIILGCTEFPLLLTNDSYFGIPVLNTTAIHIREIVNYCSGA
jgi:aspartate racemase